MDSLVRNINSVLGSSGDMYANPEGQAEGEGAGEGGSRGASVLDTTGYKHVRMRVKLAQRVSIEDVALDPEKLALVHKGQPGNVTESLQSYLGLPLEEYSVLDPAWIQRLDGADNDTFVLKVPLREMVGLELHPSLRARVETTTSQAGTEDRDAGEGGERSRPRQPPHQPQMGIFQRQLSNKVTILGEETKMGSAIFDDLVEISFTLHVMQVGNRMPGTDSRKTPNKTHLRGELLLDVEVDVPAPLNKLPIRILRSGGGTLIRLVMQRMLRGFLAALARDFESWCCNEARDSAPLHDEGIVED
ncbi:DUF1997 domain-containing protein [Chloropicon primus]|uniref:DUF1997 domain-containing protein n=1 Tax=Chloropicon primus TaxID=1764295 RepID=A0A5B8MRP4_9CHLO|nr:hypothetical protein A3770_06p44600 [Chloropicon primus]UPR01162.1 DUF1997 domain-containing protein [Chloropicon primus]|eukprot:QDZ21942.1 hypothetical protein A3770_06p44600 [Chloropicon primus]